MNDFLAAYTPNKSTKPSTVQLLIAVQVTIFFIIWAFSPFVLMPSISETWSAFCEQVQQGLLSELIVSFTANLEAIGISCIISLGLAYLTVLAGFRPIVTVLSKLRFLSMIGLSFFFTQFGPNATTFVYPSEIFPVRVRTTGHGIAAAMGKLGGFAGVFLFPYLMHWKGLLAAESAAAIASVLGLVFTIFLLPETKGKSLEELSSEAATHVERAAA